ncbi:hypothetical protein BDQ17DRAFT_1223144, partial [Cyathus striatus]
IYHFHASTAAFTEFWNESFRESSFKLSCRQTWQAFISESIRQVATYNNKSLIITSDERQIQELTRKAFEILGQEGIIECAKNHSQSECTHEYKSTAEIEARASAWQHISSATNDMDIDNESSSESSSDSSNKTTNTDQPTQAERKPIVNMVVMDGIIMGPRHCAYQDCDGNLENERTG